MSPNLMGKPDRKFIDHLAADFLDVEVRQIMTPGVTTIAEGASLRQGFRALVNHGVHSILVVGQTAGMPLGWITARGLLSWMFQEGEMTSVREAITHPPASIQPSITVREAVTALQQPGIDQLLVAHQSHHTPEGVLSPLDVMALLAR